MSAAASLKAAFTQYGHARFSFAGSDQLAAQIRAGARPDAFAAADSELPAALHVHGLVERPLAFATNRLVIAVRPGGKVRSLGDLARHGVTIATGAASVPVGAYARRVFARLPARERAAIAGNIRSEEPDVAGVVGKVASGAVDAGFVYVTDVRAAGGRLRAVELPARLRPDVTYAVAVVKGAPHRAAAVRFVHGLLAGPGRAALARAGFGRPPAPTP